MQLYVLDKNPIKSAQLIPDKYKFKMLIELGQLICSAGISDTYDSIPQGKELQAWVKNHKLWTYKYFSELLDWSTFNINMKEDTLAKLKFIKNDLDESIGLDIALGKLTTLEYEVNNAHFRYAKEYKCNIPSKTLLPIDECINQYNKYLGWKLNV